MIENLDVFFGDWGADVVAGATSGKGIFDQSDADVGGGLLIAGHPSVMLKASDFGALKFNDSISVNGVNYTVKENKLLDDGTFCRATLSKV